MKKIVPYVLTSLWLLMMLVSYWIFLPPISLLSLSFWFFVLEGLFWAFCAGLIVYLTNRFQQEKGRFAGSRARKVLSMPQPFLGKFLSTISLLMVGILFLLLASSFVNSRLFRARSYANIIQVKEANFTTDFPETDISHLALLDRSSAKKIGDTYLGTIDKVSQFGISDDYRQVTIGEQPYRVSPLEYKSFWKWLSNHKEGIGYYVKVNQTTGKAELVKLSKGMKYSDSEYFFNDTLRYLRLKYPTTIFGDPSFEVDDKGNPYYVATTYKPKFMLSSSDPTGAILLNAVTGETKRYALKDIPSWVDRVYSAHNVIARVDDYYTYQDGFWNSIFSQTGVKKTTDSYNYISIGSDIYLYTGITSATADSSNLGFILVNMRTREVTNYKLASATESAAQESAEGEVQEKDYEATAPSLVKLDGRAYYLVSLKDDAGLVKSYAIVDAEDYQQVTVDNHIETLIAKFTDSDTSVLSSVANAGQRVNRAKVITGVVDKLASQVISGSTVYYISSAGEIYKVKATKDTTDALPFLTVGDYFKGELQDDHFLTKFEITTEN